MKEDQLTEERKSSFGAALSESKWRFENNGLKASDRAYEYGVLVVKNALLISGGGLFFIPAMAGLNKSMEVANALLSGALFGSCVILVLFANYLIHWNWMLVEEAWVKIYEIEKVDIRKAYGVGWSGDAVFKEKTQLELDKTNRKVTALFYAPHFLAIAFVILFSAASYHLYTAFRISGVVQ